MKISWDPNLSVGVALIDLQHQELFRRVDGLLTAMGAHRGKDEVASILAFLRRYVVEHFAAEEQLMAARHYPEATAHRLQHAEFMRALLGIEAEFARLGPTTAVAVRVNQAVCDWLRQHIGTTDRALGTFLTAAGQGGAAA